MSLATSTTPRLARRIKSRPATPSTAARPRTRTSLGRRIARHNRLFAALLAAEREHGIEMYPGQGYGHQIDRQHPEVQSADDAVHQSERSLVRALLRRHRPDRLPTWAEWRQSPTPIVTHREGNRLFLVVATEVRNNQCDSGQPVDRTELACDARLVVVDLDA